MKQRVLFMLNRLDELFILLLFIFSILFAAWSSVPYSPAQLAELINRQSLTFKHCYTVTGGDQTTVEDRDFHTVTPLHEEYGRNACIKGFLPRGTIRVLSASKTDMVIELSAPEIEATYDKAYVIVKEGLLPLNLRIALSTRLRKELGDRCDAEARAAARTRVTAFVHTLSLKMKVTFKLSPTNWCETGPAG
jgi:hypothetical protein